MKQKGLLITAVMALGLAITMAAWASIPPPPVNQDLGMPDMMFNDFVETDCRACHNQNPPGGVPVDPTYLPDRHHLNVGGTIPVGQCNKVEVCNTTLNLCNDGTTACTTNAECETAGYGPTPCTNDPECRALSGLDDDYCTGESQVRNPDADNDGNVDTTYDCLNCHNIEWTGSAFEIVEDFRDCTSCHQTQFQPDHPDRTQEPTVHHRGTEALVDRNCQYCHGSLVDNGWGDDDSDTVRNAIDPDDGGWVPTYNPSLVTPWPSEKTFGSCVTIGDCDLDIAGVCDAGTCSEGTVGAGCTVDADCDYTGTNLCTAGNVGAACAADLDCDVDTLVFCAGDETGEIAAGRSNYCSPGEKCVQDEVTYGGGGDPLGRHAEGNCNACHDATSDPATNVCVGYDYTTDPITLGLCNGTGPSCAQDADCYGPILINHDTHHFTGLTAAGCEMCHPVRTPTHTALDIRTCENCHGIPSLHNIQVDSNGGGIVVGAEDPYYGHIGGNTDCNGCHGFSTAALAPGSGPVIPFIGSADDAGTEANTPTTVTVGGAAFTNTTMGMPFTSEAVLDGSTDNLAVSVTESEMVVNLPGLAAGKYYLRAKKYDKKSNPLVIAVTPQVTVNSVSCSGNGATTIAGSGFGSYLEASNSPTKVTGDVTAGRGKKKTQTKNETAAISSWTDTQIEAQFSACPNDGTVVVSTVWDITGGSDPPDPPPAVCGDLDQDACNAADNCRWHKKKAVCLDR